MQAGKSGVECRSSSRGWWLLKLGGNHGVKEVDSVIICRERK